MTTTKIFIATPAFDGKTHVPYTISLAETYNFLLQNGIQCRIGINTSGSLLVAERNRLIKQFLATDCTHMLCIDSDIGWPPQAVLAMIKHEKDFVAGLYPARGPENVFLFRPVEREDGSLLANEQGLFKMNFIPAGFMMIKRHVLERLCAKFSDKYFEPKAEKMKHESGYCLFETEVFEGEFWGEDYVFCKRVREAGFEIWIDPMVEFDHAGKRGAFYQMLKQKEDADKALEKKEEVKPEGS